MAERRDILCISSIDWDFIWQGHQEIMSTLAAEGHRVLFLENTGVRAPRLRDLPRLRQRVRNWSKGTGGFREERPNLFVYSPIVLPLPYSRIARWINRLLLVHSIRRWMRAVGFSRPIGLDVSADAAGARAARSSRSGADDLLLHRRSGLELARGAPHRLQRRGDVPPRRSGLRHLREAACSGRRSSRQRCTFSRSAFASARSRRRDRRRGRRRTIWRRSRGRWSGMSAACTSGSIRI